MLDTIGWTPLIRLNRVIDGAITPVYGKAEIFNPGGSVKDRIGLAMIEAAEAEGRLRPGGTIVEGTSGNTGIGLAIAAAIKGYRCVFTMPDKMSQEKVRLLKAFGADVIVTPTAVPPDHPDNYIQTAKRIVRETPGAILADQFYNDVNPRAHFETTGPEIWAQTDGRVTHLVGSAGTGGTLTGAGRFLKQQNPRVRVIAGDPAGSIYAHYHSTHEKLQGSPYKVEGIGGDKLPTTLDFDVIDAFHTVSDREAFHMARRLTREEGLFVGGSSGVNAAIAVRIAHELADPGALIVCILPDTGERYLSKVYNEEWLREHQLLEPERMTAGDMLARKDGPDIALAFVAPGASNREALALITRHDISQVPVCTEDHCFGSITESILMARVIEDPAILDQPVETLMDAPLPIIESNVWMSGVGRLLNRHTPAVLVREDGRFKGIITRYDVVRYLTG
ncbi:MAG: pyridoxal-phosphate dependent enzyme [Gemmatimonadetes bacterium]|nr:pyridoxal-phosphate dependent enzyme [Gemmatimonadota bacterium]